jgi:hypothetical protein
MSPFQASGFYKEGIGVRRVTPPTARRLGDEQEAGRVGARGERGVEVAAGLG